MQSAPTFFTLRKRQCAGFHCRIVHLSRLIRHSSIWRLLVIVEFFRQLKHCCRTRSINFCINLFHCFYSGERNVRIHADLQVGIMRESRQNIRVYTQRSWHFCSNFKRCVSALFVLSSRIRRLLNSFHTQTVALITWEDSFIQANDCHCRPFQTFRLMNGEKHHVRRLVD